MHCGCCTEDDRDDDVFLVNFAADFHFVSKPCCVWQVHKLRFSRIMGHSPDFLSINYNGEAPDLAHSLNPHLCSQCYHHFLLTSRQLLSTLVRSSLQNNNTCTMVRTNKNFRRTILHFGRQRHSSQHGTREGHHSFVC